MCLFVFLSRLNCIIMTRRFAAK